MILFPDGLDSPGVLQRSSLLRCAIILIIDFEWLCQCRATGSCPCLAWPSCGNLFFASRLRLSAEIFFCYNP